MLNKFCTTLIVSLIFLIINTVNPNALNQATGENVRSCGYVELDIYQGPTAGAFIRDCCDYQVDLAAGKLVPGSLTCKRIFCYDVNEGDQGFVRCITLSVISPPAGAPLEELLPGNVTLPPSIEPGDLGPELPPSIAPGSENFKVPKTNLTFSQTDTSSSNTSNNTLAQLQSDVEDDTHEEGIGDMGEEEEAG